MQIKTIEVKDYLVRSNIKGIDYTINPYVGCPHACKYCYAEFMKRFTNHKEPWGTFLDVKFATVKRIRFSTPSNKPTAVA